MYLADFENGNLLLAHFQSNITAYMDLINYYASEIIRKIMIIDDENYYYVHGNVLCSTYNFIIFFS